MTFVTLQYIRYGIYNGLPPTYREKCYDIYFHLAKLKKILVDLLKRIDFHCNRCYE